MRATFAIARAVVTDAVRRKVVWAVAVFAALLAFAVPSLPSYGQGVVGAVYREVTIALMYAAALVVALALSATRIPAEVERRTVFSILARDVRRWQYVAGSWAGMLVVVGAALLAFSAVAMGVGFYVYHEVMWRLLEGALGVWLEMGVIMAFTVMLSTRFGPITSVVGTLAFVFIGHSYVGLLYHGEGVTAPWYLPSLEPFNIINPVAHGAGYSAVYALGMLGAFAAWSALLLIGGGVLFAGRDL